MKIFAILLIVFFVLFSPLFFIAAAKGALAILGLIVRAIARVCELVDEMLYGEDDES